MKHDLVDRTPELGHSASKRPALTRPPLGLLDLPTELLDELALYFRAGEAKPVLTAHSILHDVFTRCIWRSIERATDSVIWRFSPSGWQRYGHLVRRVSIRPATLNYILLESIQNVVHLSFELPCLETVLGNGATHKMRNLQRVTVNYSFTYKPVNKHAALANSWLFKAKKSGQCVSFTWMLIINEQFTYINVCKFADCLADTEMNTVSVMIRDTDELDVSKMSKLALMANEIDAHSSLQFSLLTGRHPGVTFPQLQKLKLLISAFESVPQIQGVTGFIPDRFPSLKEFELCYKHNDLDIIRQLFLHTWHSITSLELRNVENSLMLDHIVQRLPNVTHLTLSWCPCPINLPFMAINLPNLQYLTLDHTEEIAVGAGEQPALFSSLVQLSLTRYGTSPMKHGALSCIINSAPYVHTLIIRGYLISKESLGRFTGQSNRSVISLVTGLRAWDRSHREQVDHLLALFPNTRCLKLIIVDYSDIRSMREHHPNVNFINVKASRYSY